MGAAPRRDVLVRMGSSPPPASRVPPLAGEVAGAERSESPAKCSVMNDASRKAQMRHERQEKKLLVTFLFFVFCFFWHTGIKFG